MSDEDELRAYTEDEVREHLLDHIRSAISYWASVSGKGNYKDNREILAGLAFSMLTIIDGTSSADFSFDLTVRCDSSDPDYHRENGENWYQDGMVINEAIHLHDMLYEK